MGSPNAGPLAVRRRLSLSTLLIPVLVAGLADARVLAASPAPGDRAPVGRPLSTSWKLARSPHFVIAGNGSEGELRRAAREMELFRDVLQQMFPSLRLSSPVATTVILFGDDASFARFKPIDRNGRRVETVTGFFMPLPDTNYIVANVHHGRDFSLEVAFHEYTHYVLDQNAHGSPLWFNEGVADYYSTFRLDPVTGHPLIGTPPAARLAWLRRCELLPLEKMLSTAGAVRLFQAQQDRATFYAQSWALVHYLTLGNSGKRRPQLNAYLDNLKRGLSIDQAFRAAFDCTYRQLEQELWRYISSDQLPALKVYADERPAGTVDVAPMAEADARALQADVLVRLHSKDAEEAVAGVLAREPSHRQARLSLALLRLQQQREAEAIDVLQGLLAENGDDGAAQLYLATALMEAGRQTEALEAAEQATALNGQSPSAWFRLAEAAAAAGREGQATAAMDQSQQLRADPDRYREGAYELFRLGMDAAATRDGHAFLDQAGWGNEWAARVALLASLAHRRLGQTADADALLARARGVVEGGSWKESLVDYFQGGLTAQQLLSRAREDGEKTEARTYVGLHEELAGRRDEALSDLRWVKEQGNTSSAEYALALGALKRLEKAAPPIR